MMKIIFVLLCFISLNAFAGTFKVSVTPEGAVKSPKQVRAVFTEPMVPMGNVNAASPFDFACAQAGKGMWEDSKTWIFEFDTELEGGKNCQFTLKPGTKSAAGDSLEGPGAFSFNTGGPFILTTRPYSGYSVESDQAFLLELDVEPDLSSLNGHAYFQVNGIPEKIPAKVLDQASMKKVLETTSLKTKKGGHFLLLQAARPLPENTDLSLVWGVGIKAKSGMETTQQYEHHFRTRPVFTAKFTCSRENAGAACNPIASSLGMEFTSPISRKDAEKIRLKSGSQEWKPNFGKDKRETVTSFQFAGIFPANAQLTVTIPPGLKDEVARPLANAKSFPLKVATAEYPPLVKFSADFGILEASDPVLPVTVRNVEPALSGTRIIGSKLKLNADKPVQVLDWLKRKSEDYSHDNRGISVFNFADTKDVEHFELPKPNGKEAFEVIGIPLGGKGLHVVELASPKLGASLLPGKGTMYVHSTVLVTDLGVHFKLGEGHALAWVTQLSTGKPVADAEVKIYDGTGKVLGSGKTDKNGILKIVKEKEYWKPAESSRHQELYVFATKGDDFAFVSSDWSSGLESWRFSLSSAYEQKRGGIAHTVFDRTLFRAGEKVHMKHYLREKYLRGLREMPAPPKNLVVRSSVGQIFVYPIAFDKNGHGSFDWSIPKEAKLGTYRVYLVSKDVKPSKISAVTEENEGEDEYFSAYGDRDFEVGSFRVEEFRLPVLKGAIAWGKTSDKGVEADIAVQYLAGGAAAKLPTLIRGRWEKLAGKSFSDWDDFTFANGGVKVGRTSRNYSDYEESDYYEGSGSGNEEKNKSFVDIETQRFELDANGAHRFTVAPAPKWETGAALRVEGEFKDPNGEIVTVSRSSESFPGNSLVGIKTDGWFSTQDNVKFKIAAVDTQGNPLRGRAVKAQWLNRSSYSHRKRILGGFYSYENYDDVAALGVACSGKTDDHGVLACEGKAPATGNLMLVAEVQGSTVKANRELWISGKDNMWFSQGDSDRIDIIPEKKRYEPGEKAKFQVRMPFSEATALVAVEREGISQTFVQELTAANPTVEIPVLGEFAPNIYVSVLVIRGRVGSPPADALVDLAKPAFKFGIAEISVGWKKHELKVKVETPQEEYHVRQKVKAKFQVTRADGGAPAAGGEVVVAVVDEALLELKDNSSWKLLEAMMEKHPYLMRTVTSQGMVIGKRHFGLKALPAGGGGGHMTSRELFDTLLYWNPKVKLDSSGRGEVEFTLNDSMSSFRIVAVASEDLDKFGTGQTKVRSTQDLMIFSGVSPVARSGDSTNPEITVRNATNHSMKVKVKGSTDAGNSFAEKNLQLAGGESQKLSWSYEVPFGHEALAYTFEVSGGEEQDKISVKQKVMLPLRETVLQSTLEQLDKKMEVPVKLPENAVRDGSFVVRMDKSLLPGLVGVKNYMELYPYSCLEQQASKAV
ncbi:MAG: MG2 domain-containing protein, partial [Bdellovibrionota bacterium]